MLLIPMPLHTATRRRVATAIFVGLVAAGYVWFDTRAPGSHRPKTAGEWAARIVVVAILFACYRWVIQFPKQVLRNEPPPSIRPRAKSADRD